jgi:hypothetical protein
MGIARWNLSVLLKVYVIVFTLAVDISNAFWALSESLLSTSYFPFHPVF